MSYVGAVIARGNNLPTTLTAATTNGGTNGAVIKGVSFCNKTTAAVTVTLLIRPSGGSGSTDIYLYDAVSVPAQGAGPLTDVPFTALYANDTLYWSASATSAVDCVVSGVTY